MLNCFYGKTSFVAGPIDVERKTRCSASFHETSRSACCIVIWAKEFAARAIRPPHCEVKTERFVGNGWLDVEDVVEAFRGNCEDRDPGLGRWVYILNRILIPSHQNFGTP